MLKAARIKAGLSTEKASWLLHIGRRTLINYEGYQSVVPPEIVLKMQEVYNDPSLTAKYCSDYCPIGQIYANPVETKDLATAVLGFVKEYNDVRLIRNKLIEVASDGIISDKELPDFITVLDELMDLEQKIETLKLFAARFVALDQLIQKKKEKTAATAAVR